MLKTDLAVNTSWREGRGISLAKGVRLYSFNCGSKGNEKGGPDQASSQHFTFTFIRSQGSVSCQLCLFYDEGEGAAVFFSNFAFGNKRDFCLFFFYELKFPNYSD